jgi:hypothetical protein
MTSSCDLWCHQVQSQIFRWLCYFPVLRQASLCSWMSMSSLITFIFTFTFTLLLSLWVSRSPLGCTRPAASIGMAGWVVKIQLSKLGWKLYTVTISKTRRCSCFVCQVSEHLA